MDMIGSKTEERLTCALGEAVVHVWSHLSPDVQQELFEQVIASHGESARQALAVFLHDHHQRTAPLKRRDAVEPDSLGG